MYKRVLIKVSNNKKKMFSLPSPLKTVINKLVLGNTKQYYKSVVYRALSWCLFGHIAFSYLPTLR